MFFLTQAVKSRGWHEDLVSSLGLGFVNESDRVAAVMSLKITSSASKSSKHTAKHSGNSCYKEECAAQRLVL
jgi:hypothetical protein